MYYENLPIYKSSVQLCVYIEQSVQKFSRYHRYQLGADLRRQSRALVSLVIQANFAGDKIAAITELRNNSEEMKLLVVLAKEVKAFNSFNQFQQAAQLSAEISRQSQGWLNSQRHNRPESSSARPTSKP